MIVNTLCFLSGFFLFFLYYRKKIGDFKQVSKAILQRATTEADEIVVNAKLEAKQQTLKAHEEIESRKQSFEKRLNEKEDRLTKLSSELHQLQKELSFESKEVKRLEKLASNELERISGLTEKEGKEYLLETLNEDLSKEFQKKIYRFEQEFNKEKERVAAETLSSVLSRLAAPVVKERTQRMLPLRDKVLKGRLIGREGRNIRSFEEETGVNVFIDDQADSCQLSCFDPIRLFVATKALEKLFEEGRIHPTSIRRVVAEVKESVKACEIKEGTLAATKAGVSGLHSALIHRLGQLSFQSSLGQNLLTHSVEVSQLMGLLAAELKLDVALAKRIGLLHDIGKGERSSTDVSHAKAGFDLVLRFGESAAVANGILAHHGEVKAETVEATLLQTADTLSAARPLARIEAVEEYIQRHRDLEQIAKSFPGVQKAHALQAGSSLHVVVSADEIAEERAANLAREITLKIEKSLSYPGRIQVTVSREKSVVSYAY